MGPAVGRQIGLDLRARHRDSGGLGSLNGKQIVGVVVVQFASGAR
jgi:hypothetical protein